VSNHVFLLLNCRFSDFRTSCSYDNYPEDNAASLYGVPGPDPHGVHFPDFDYSGPSI
jgi:hypothetical protein